jgi:putative ABC transport system permease protein
MSVFDLDHWQEIKTALLRNRTRTALTAFGVFWGIFLLMVMLGSGTGLRNASPAASPRAPPTASSSGRSAPRSPTAACRPGARWSSTTTTCRRSATRCPRSPSWRRATSSAASWVATTSPAAQGRRVQRHRRLPGIRRIQSFRMEEGRFLDPLDVADGRKVAVIGTHVREVLFKEGEKPIGDSIEIRGVYFQVVGIFSSLQSGDQGERESQTIFIPFTTFQRAFNYGDRVGWLAVTSKPSVPASVAEDKVLELLRSRHKVAPDDSRAFGHWNTEKEYSKIQSLFGGIGILVWLVGIGTLAAGAIGVSNIMLIIVKERTKEIGVRRAVGARPSAIVAQIVLESVILTASAGYLGLVRAWR